MSALKRSKQNILKHLFIAFAALFCVAVCVLLFCLNITPAVALEQTLRCGIPVHIHADKCYDGDFLTCKQTAHSHDGNCYIVLLKENDINTLLTLLDQTETRSLEYVITSLMSSALTLNENINAPPGEDTDSDASGSGDSVSLTPSTVEQLNQTISEEESLPNIVLNEQLNALAADSVADDTSNLSLNAEPETGNLNANFYIYLDGEWTCIGSLPFSTSRNGRYYNATLATEDVLNLVNGVLGTEYDYNSFDISVSSSENGTYSKSNLSMGRTTTTIGYRQSNTNAQAAKYVHLIPNNGSASSTAFAFYTVRYIYLDGSTLTQYVRSGTDVTLPSGNYEWSGSDGGTYAAGETVTVTDTLTFTAQSLGPITYVNINYNVNFPSVDGVTVETEPTIAGLTVARVTDGFSENSSAVIRNVSQHTVAGEVNGNGTGLSRVIQFKGWQVGNTDVVLQPNTTLLWEELLQYASGSSLNLTAIWEYDSVQTASFFIRFDSVAVDTDGNITGQDQNLYTNELFAAYVGGIDPDLGYSELHDRYHIVDTTADNSYGADQEIRALYGEKTEGVWLSGFPSDDFIFESLVQYAQTGYLSVDGDPVKVEDLNKNEYAIRWYVFKAQSDAWHIDGKLVKKVGMIHVYKSFAGNQELIGSAKEGFYIDAYDQNDDSHETLRLADAVSYDADTETYQWEISGLDYGEPWVLTEYPGLTPDGTFSIYSEYSVTDAHGDQSTEGEGVSLTVNGMTYALDEGTDGILRVNFNNIYNRGDSIVIKKQDSRTGLSIGGATFQLLQNGQVLKFRYDSAANRYLYDPENGTETVLEGTANGYFEISIQDFSYDLGPITVREISPPRGYTPIADIAVGYVGSSEDVGILSGNSDLIKYVNGVLIVSNSTDAVSVTAQKVWDCPENEWQNITVQLLANGKLVSSILSGVTPEVILSTENAWTYTWENLPVYANGAEIVWSLKETVIGTEAAKSDGSFVNWLASYSLPVTTTDGEGNTNVLLTVTNTTKRVMLRLTKTDISKSVQLPGATFMLHGVDESGNVLTSEVVKTAVTGDAGTLIFDNLKTNFRYRLTEISAPSGYLKTDEYIYFTINEDGSVSVESSYYAEAGTSAYNLIVRNTPAIPLPESGSGGTLMYGALGLLLTAAGAGIYIDILRKRRCRN